MFKRLFLFPSSHLFSILSKLRFKCMSHFLVAKNEWEKRCLNDAKEIKTRG